MPSIAMTLGRRILRALVLRVRLIRANKPGGLLRELKE
jgi:hypothetical protein